MKKRKNSDLLKLPHEVLGEIERQMVYLIRIDLNANPCPVCKKMLNFFEAAGITIDDYDGGSTKYQCRCPSCTAPLTQVIPFYPYGNGGWFWDTDPVFLQQIVDKARKFDEQEKAKEGS